jgi:hypothetical protein
MTRYLPAVLIALCVALGVALAAQRSSLNAARQELEQVQTRVERLEAKQKESAARKAVEELQEQVAKVERKAAAASVAAEAANMAVARPAPKDANTPVPFTEDDITKIVEARLEEKLQGKGAKKNDDDRKMPLFDLAKELTLDPAVQTKVAAIANTAKKEIFDILRTPRPDGTNAADDVIQAFTSGNQEEAQKIFVKLFTEKIPGTQTTYVAAVTRVQEKANQGLSAAMGGDAFGRFQGMGVKPENIETGFDPWAEYLQQKGK